MMYVDDYKYNENQPSVLYKYPNPIVIRID